MMFPSRILSRVLTAIGVGMLLLAAGSLSLQVLAAQPGVRDVEEEVLLVDDFAPQPVQGDEDNFWPHNRLGGDRGPIDRDNGRFEWGEGLVTATITGSTKFGLYTSLNHPITDHIPLNFSSIFPPQIEPEYQGRIKGLQIQDLKGQGTFLIELRAQDPLPPLQEITVWSQSVVLSSTAQNLQFSLPITLGEIQNLNWQIIGDVGDFVVIDQIQFIAELPQLGTPERAFLWSYAMLLANWDSESGLTRDHAYYAAGGFDNISASGMQAAAAVMAWHLSFISEASATEIVSRTTQALLALPDCHGLWPHFVENGQIITGTEWSSIDTTIAMIALLKAQGALGFDTTTVGQALTSIDWEALILGNNSVSHGYRTNCQERIEDKDGGLTGGWQDFGTESWLASLGYGVATGKLANFDHTPPTYNGSGFIDELAWLLAPPPCYDRWGTAWCDYSQQAADKQLDYYQNHSCYQGPPRLFGLSAAEVPDLSAVPVAQQLTQTYQAFGVGGESPSGAVIPPNDGTNLAWLGHAVIVPHYAAMIASIRPTQAIALWEWLEMRELFTPLNNVESLMFIDEPACSQLVWNALKGSWNLSLQTLGWGRLLAGDNNPLYQSTWVTCNYGPTNTLSSATDNLDQDAADWGVFCEGAPIWAKENVSAPSLDGQSLRCGILGGEPYSNVHCYRNLLPEPTANVFTMTMSFRFTPTTTCNNQGSPSTVQALEFTMNKWHHAKRYEFALQWQNVGEGGPQWRYWDPHQSPNNRWVPISPTFTQCLAAGEWYTLTLAGEIINEHVHYQSFTVGQDSHPLDLTILAFNVSPNEPDRLAIAVQLDGNAAQSPYDLFIDRVSFVRQSIIYLPIIVKS